MMTKNESAESLRFLPSGLDQISLPQDGDCFYHAIRLYISDMNIHDLRVLAANYIDNHKPYFLEFYNACLEKHNCNIDQYLNYLRNPDQIPEHHEEITWADDLIIQALSYALDRDIVILENDGSVAKQTLPNSTHDPIFVLYNGVDHYSGLQLNGSRSASDILTDLDRCGRFSPGR